MELVPLLQGQSDPLLPGQRKASLKYQSPVKLLELVWGQSALMELSADLEVALVVLPVVRKKQWSIRV